MAKGLNLSISRLHNAQANSVGVSESGATARACALLSGAVRSYVRLPN